jgi:hypothetical protein
MAEASTPYGAKAASLIWPYAPSTSANIARSSQGSAAEPGIRGLRKLEELFAGITSAIKHAVDVEKVSRECAAVERCHLGC